MPDIQRVVQNSPKELPLNAFRDTALKRSNVLIISLAFNISTAFAPPLLSPLRYFCQLAEYGWFRALACRSSSGPRVVNTTFKRSARSGPGAVSEDPRTADAALRKSVRLRAVRFLDGGCRRGCARGFNRPSGRAVIAPVSERVRREPLRPRRRRRLGGFGRPVDSDEYFEWRHCFAQLQKTAGRGVRRFQHWRSWARTCSWRCRGRRSGCWSFSGI